jgi:hypothetical protein
MHGAQLQYSLIEPSCRDCPNTASLQEKAGAYLGERALSKGEGQGTYVYAGMNSLVLIRPIPTTFLDLILQTKEHNFEVDILHSQNISICCNHGNPSAHPIFFSISHRAE